MLFSQLLQGICFVATGIWFALLDFSAFFPALIYCGGNRITHRASEEGKWKIKD